MLPAGPPSNSFFINMSDATRARMNRNYILCCAVDMRPFSMLQGVGAQLFVGGLNPPVYGTANLTQD
ncbi:unnamed protein product, partial [Phaeothamnion confervicola]